MHPSYYPNLALKILKWPIAVLALAALPFSVLAIGDSALMNFRFGNYQWMVYGAGAYWLSWWLIFRHRFAGSYFSTFEHELTHAIFAWGTLHWVTGLTVTWRQGGACEFVGSGGNWLIAIAPYWFPTLVWPCILLTYFLDSTALPTLNFLTGAAIVYHVTSTWRETHPGQTDLHETTFLFAWMFLPTANIIVYAFILLLATSGSDEAFDYLGDVWQQLSAWIMNYVDPWFRP